MNAHVNISVIIPCFNASKYLSETIQSVLRQTYEACEVLVIDDGSEDDSRSIAASFGDPVVVVSQKNAGECAARNRGIELAKGDWLAFLDADDLWLPEKLEVQTAAMQRDAVCIHSGFFLFGSQSGVPAAPREVEVGDYRLETLLVKPLINSSSAMVKAGLPARFPVGVRQGGDMIYFAELSQLGRFQYTSQAVVGYRMHPAQITRRSDAWVEHFRNRFRWLEQKRNQLGEARTLVLDRLLHEQVIEWLDLARWNRQWDRYDALKQFARTLTWDATPAVLTERLYPRMFYRAKDVLDDVCLGALGRCAARRPRLALSSEQSYRSPTS